MDVKKIEGCSICCENYNNSKRRETACPYCDKSACMECYMKIFLNNSNPAECVYPDCTDGEHGKKPWNIQYLSDNFPKSFIWGQGTNAKGATDKTTKSYRQHREEILADQQMSLMPATQPEVEKDIKVNKLKEKIKTLSVEISDNYKTLYSPGWQTARRVIIENIYHVEISRDCGIIVDYDSATDTYSRKESYNELHNRINKKRELTNKLYLDRYRLNNQIREIRRLALFSLNGQEKEKEPKVINRGHCPNDDCNGFISKGYKCGICETKICKSCKELVSIEELDNAESNKKNIEKFGPGNFVLKDIHECNDEILKTMEELRKNNYKSCPQCRVSIERSYGCNQIWCVNCHVFFDWKSGKEIKKTRFVHNPHYQEWINEGGGRAEGELEDELARIGDCDVNSRSIRSLDIKDQYKNTLNTIIRFVNELRDQCNASDTAANLDRNLLKLRKKFLFGDYGKDKTKAKLKLGILIQRAHKRESKINEAYQIRDMFSDVCFQILAKLLVDSKELKEKKTTYDFSNSLGILGKTTKNIKKSIMKFFNSGDSELELLVVDALEQILGIYEYSVDNMEKLGKRYNSGTPPLNGWNSSGYGVDDLVFINMLK
jgi:hypothetical protein